MSLLSTVMNRSAELTLSESFFTKNIASRLMTLTLCPPLEAAEVIINTIKLPLHVCQLAVKIPTTVINLGINSTTLREFQDNLCGPLDIIRTALKITGLTLGFFFSLTLGALSPMSNFRLHYAFGLVRDENLERQLEAKRQEEKKKKEAYERMLEDQIKRVTDALRLKVVEAAPLPMETLVEDISTEKPQEDKSEEHIEENLSSEPIAISEAPIAQELTEENIIAEDVVSGDGPGETSDTKENIPQQAA